MKFLKRLVRLNMTQNNDEAFHKIMAQVQVYASSYALVGTRFATDNQLEEADREKLSLYNMVKSALSQSPISHNEQQESVTNLWEALGKWSAYLASNGEQANLAPPSWLIDAVSSATSPPKQIPDGWKLVPIVLTRKQKLAMISEYEDATGGCRLPDGDGYDEEIVQQMHQAMINASPTTTLTRETNTEVGE